MLQQLLQPRRIVILPEQRLQQIGRIIGIEYFHQLMTTVMFDAVMTAI